MSSERKIKVSYYSDDDTYSLTSIIHVTPIISDKYHSLRSEYSFDLLFPDWIKQKNKIQDVKNPHFFENSCVFLQENDMDNIHKGLEIASRNHSIAAFVTQKPEGDFNIPICVLNKSAISNLQNSTMKAKILFFPPSSGAAFASNDHHIKNESQETYASVTSQEHVTKSENTNFSNNTSQEHVTKSEDTNFSNNDPINVLEENIDVEENRSYARILLDGAKKLLTSSSQSEKDLELMLSKWCKWNNDDCDGNSYIRAITVLNDIITKDASDQEKNLTMLSNRLMDHTKKAKHEIDLLLLSFITLVWKVRGDKVINSPLQDKLLKVILQAICNLKINNGKNNLFDLNFTCHVAYMPCNVWVDFLDYLEHINLSKIPPRTLTRMLWIICHHCRQDADKIWPRISKYAQATFMIEGVKKDLESFLCQSVILSITLERETSFKAFCLLLHGYIQQESNVEVTMPSYLSSKVESLLQTEFSLLNDDKIQEFLIVILDKLIFKENDSQNMSKVISRLTDRCSFRCQGNFDTILKVFSNIEYSHSRHKQITRQVVEEICEDLKDSIKAYPANIIDIPEFNKLLQSKLGRKLVSNSSILRLIIQFIELNVKNEKMKFYPKIGFLLTHYISVKGILSRNHKHNFYQFIKDCFAFALQNYNSSTLIDLFQYAAKNPKILAECPEDEPMLHGIADEAMCSSSLLKIDDKFLRLSLNSSGPFMKILVNRLKDTLCRINKRQDQATFLYNRIVKSKGVSNEFIMIAEEILLTSFEINNSKNLLDFSSNTLNIIDRFFQNGLKCHLQEKKDSLKTNLTFIMKNLLSNYEKKISTQYFIKELLNPFEELKWKAIQNITGLTIPTERYFRCVQREPVVCKLPEPASQSKQLQNKNLRSGFPPMSETAPSSFSQQSSKVSFGTELQQKNIENKDGNINSFSLSLPSAMKSDVIDKNTDVSNREKKVSFSLINTNKVGVEPTEQIANNRMESKLVENQVEKIPTNKEINYYSILANFYQKHNPTKVGEVEKTLNKYKGNEVALFQKLSKMYNSLNPLDSTMATPPEEPVTSSIGGLTNSPFNSTPQKPSSFGSNPSMMNSSGSFPTSSPFGMKANQDMDTPSVFANIRRPSFTQPKSVSPFTFGASSGFPPSESTSSFFQNNSTFNQSISQEIPVKSVTFGGKTPREILTAFYQKYNPTKVSVVDKLLHKYNGNEEQMFRNLAKKYNVDPSIFGLGSTAIPFGRPSSFGANAPTSIGAKSQSNQSSTGFGSFNSQTNASSGLGTQGVFSSPSASEAFGNMGGGLQSFGSTNVTSPQFSFGSSTPFT